MPPKFKSPYAKPFITGCKNGTPCTTVVNTISKRTGKPVSTIWNSLCKAGVCCCCKFNGTCVYWPNFPVKKNPTVGRTCQTNMWQCFIDWCMCTGCCTPTQLNRNCSSQKTFMNFCRSFFGKQFTPMTMTKTKRSPKRRTMRKPRRTTTTWAKSPMTRGKKRPAPKRGRKTTPKTWTWNRTTPRTYKFPTWRISTNTRRYRYAA